MLQNKKLNEQIQTLSNYKQLSKWELDLQWLFADDESLHQTIIPFTETSTSLTFL